jgi:colanic acid biosynthesis glycosyl transferase WcaI
VRVVFLTHYYPPEVGAPQARIAALARGLSERGIAVSVHTGFPNYPDGAIQPPYRNRPWSREDAGGVAVLRSAVYPAPNRGFVRRLANHATFAASAIATTRLSGPADVVVAETPPLFLAGAAIGYARMKRAPLVLHVADLWPDSAVELGMLRRPSAIAIARRLERRCYRAAAAIACPTQGIERILSAREEAAAKVRWIPPSVDTARFAQLALPNREAADRDSPFRVLYAGTVGLSQGLDTLLDAAELLEGEAIEILIAGDGADAPELRRRLAEGGPANVRMLGAVAHEQVPGLYAEADAAVVLLRDRPLFHRALPTKMFEALAAGRPLVLSAAGEAAKLIEAGSCGVPVAPERPDQLAAALSELAANRARAAELGAAGRRLVLDRFGRRHALDGWERLLRELADGDLLPLAGAADRSTSGGPPQAPAEKANGR